MSRRIAALMAVWLVGCMAGQPAATGASYEDTVRQAENLWAQGKKLEAVQLYGAIWRQKPDDVDRQILYGERSAEVGNYRWALNFLRVAEVQVKDDTSRLRRIYLGYAKTYRLAGRSTEAKPYEEKAAALRSPEKAEKPEKTERAVTPRATAEPYYFGYYTEKPPTGGQVSPSPTSPVRYRKKRIAVAPVTLKAGASDLGGYASQLHAMLITELRKTNQFIVVERENLEGILAEQNAAASGSVAAGAGAKSGRLLGAELMVKAEITDFEDQLAHRREIGIGPVDVGRGQTTVRVAMDMRMFNTETGVVVASERVSAEKVAGSQDLHVNVSVFRWDDQKSQNSTLGFVTAELVQKALEKIIANSEKVPWAARVMKVSGDEVYFNAGVEVGVRVGDRFKVMSVGETLTDPVTGEVLATEEKEAGEIESTRVDKQYSVGRVLSKKVEIREFDKIVAP